MCSSDLAAQAGDMAKLKRLLAAGASVRARDESGRTALLAATQHNRVEAARVLMEAGADVNAQDNQRDSAFLLAGASGHTEIVRLALRHGANLKLTNRYGGTALIPACHHGHVDTVRELLKSDIDVNHVNSLGWTALLEAIILGNGSTRYTEVVGMLLRRGANANINDRDGVSPLAHAQKRGYKDISTLLQMAGGAP